MSASRTSMDQLATAVEAARDKHGENFVALDVSGLFPLSDIFFLVSGRSERNVQAIADEVEDKMIAAGTKRIRREGRAAGRWILLDFGDIIVHIFHQEERAYYDLERLWKDCPAISLDVPEASVDA
ncbi:ribosome silencing factor [Klugiella xanthotipulae]|uniref:Ribosomal silencing factor RsfS n=1 Tax=Klugiella xanthotipulae TaxID=244735 RepID=A0A543HSK5_9MICO|nr:ribosome silencing factor [Klugiella xanthotipulae]TQM61244.1 ribosome-associated protein [Klugiella xanthotipulae]